MLLQALTLIDTNKLLCHTCLQDWNSGHSLLSAVAGGLSADVYAHQDAGAQHTRTPAN